MTIETARFIGEITNCKPLLEKIEKEQKEHSKEDKDMCLAIMEMYNDGVKAGKKEALEVLEEERRRGLKVLEQEHKRSLKVLVQSLSQFLPDVDSIYQAVIQNEIYADVTREQVREIFAR